MALEANRLHYYLQNHIFRSYEMVDFLHNVTRLPDPICETIIGAWIGVLRSEVLSRCSRDRQYLSDIKQGRGTIYLDNYLIPEGWDKESAWSPLAERTDLPLYQIDEAFQVISRKLESLRGEKPFEPVGWFRTNDGGFTVLLWRDFLQPRSYRTDDERWWTGDAKTAS